MVVEGGIVPSLQSIAEPSAGMPREDLALIAEELARSSLAIDKLERLSKLARKANASSLLEAASPIQFTPYY